MYCPSPRTFLLVFQLLVCIEVLKHAPNMGLRHRRDSISGLSTHSQPMVFGSAFGTQSPAPSYHSGALLTGNMAETFCFINILKVNRLQICIRSI